MRKRSCLEKPTNSETDEKKQPKSGAQRAREHYARLKEERPEAYAKKLCNQRVINVKRREYLKTEATDEEKAMKREKHNEYMREWRKRKAETNNTSTAIQSKAPSKPTTRKDVEKDEMRKKKDRERKQLERNGWSSQKRTAERKKARERYQQKKGKRDDVQDEENEVPTFTTDNPSGRSREARYMALHRVKKALPKEDSARQQVIEDLFKRTNKKEAHTSLTEVILVSTNSSAEDRTFKRLLAKKLQFLPREKAKKIAKDAGLKTNHLKSFISKNFYKFKCKQSALNQLKARQVVQFFFENSRVLPLKKGAAKAAKRILEKPLIELYADYQQTNRPKISFSFFCRRRPASIKTHLSMQLNQALCEVCENVNLKLKALNSQEIGVTISQFLKTALCGSESKHYLRKSIDGQCQLCGPNKVKKLANTVALNLDEEVQVKEWSWREIKRNGKLDKKKGLVCKVVSRREVLDGLLKDFKTFPSHLFKAKWQYDQYLEKKRSLNQDELMATLDFAENFRCQSQDEAQSAHWSYQQATLFPVVFNYKCTVCSSITTEAVDIISDDLSHDSAAVKIFTMAALQHVTRERSFSRFIQFTDGCAAQFKSKKPFFDIQMSRSCFGIDTERHFFGSRHGKNPSDGEAAVVKSAAMRAIKCRRSVIQDASDFYNFGAKTLSKQGSCANHYLRQFVFVSTETVKAERAKSTFQPKPISGTRAIQVVQSWDKGQSLRHRTLSCFCAGCEDGGNCQNADYVDDWEYFKENEVVSLYL